MWDTCAVDLRVNLPRTVAAEVEEVQRNEQYEERGSGAVGEACCRDGRRKD